jgi:hypothetical protein
MKKRIQFYLVVACVIVLFDLIGSVMSRTLVFDYTKLGWVSWGLYFAAGYFGCKYFDLLSGVVAGLVAGLSDSTVGWAVSSAIGPYIPFTQPPYTLLLILIVVIIVSSKSTFLGLIGALFCKIIKRSGRFADA